ncbi:proline racemase [Bacillus sp. VT-16-64]|nr:proline racemase [Bacillus sp. VT-16-64]
MKLQKMYHTTDVHVAGEVFRIIHDGPLVHYRSLQQLEEQLPATFSEEMKLLVKEPRGFAGITGCLVVPPVSEEAEVAVIFFDHEGTVPVHNAGVAAITTALLENGRLKEKQSSEYLIETVQGIVFASALMEKEQVVSVIVETGSFTLVKSDIPFLEAMYTLVQGEHLYALFDAKEVGAVLELANLSELKEWGRQVVQKLARERAVERVVLMDWAEASKGRVKSVTFREDGWLVRSPGFGSTAACFTSLVGKGEIRSEQRLVNESIFGSFLEANLLQVDGDNRFRIRARGFMTGAQTFILDPTDPLPDGFLLK